MAGNTFFQQVFCKQLSAISHFVTASLIRDFKFQFYRFSDNRFRLVQVGHSAYLYDHKLIFANRLQI